MRRLYKLGDIAILSVSEAAPGLRVANVDGDCSIIDIVQAEMRAGGQEGNMCRVAGEWSLIRYHNVNARHTIDPYASYSYRPFKVSNVDEKRQDRRQ